VRAVFQLLRSLAMQSGDCAMLQQKRRIGSDL
jgi:hypothetical protein